GHVQHGRRAGAETLALQNGTQPLTQSTQDVLLRLGRWRPVDAERTDGPPVLVGHRDGQREQHGHGGGDPAEALAADGQLGRSALASTATRLTCTGVTGGPLTRRVPGGRIWSTTSVRVSMRSVSTAQLAACTPS